MNGQVKESCKKLDRNIDKDHNAIFGQSLNYSELHYH